MKVKSFHLGFLILIFISALSLTGCSEMEFTDGIHHTYELDKTFRNFYKQLGGSDTLGSIISESFAWEANQCQYTENALMCINSDRGLGQEFFLFPVGVMFGINDQPINSFSNSNFENSNVTYAAFQTFYEELGGELIFGKTLTPVRYNMQEKRIEQYFENLGLYQSYFNEGDGVHLLAYGVFACNDECQFSADREAAVNFTTEMVPLPFLNYLDSFGNINSFGEPLTAPLEIQPGLVQQVYQNVVLIGNPSLPETIHLLDISIRLGERQDTPGPQIYTLDENMEFYVVSSPNGFHVPVVFDSFISQHGGRELSGSPISEVYYEGDKVQQCFQNYCLVYLPSEQVVQMAPLGEQFLETMEIQKAQVVNFDYSPETVTVDIKEKSNHVAFNEEQEIMVYMLRTDNRNPIQNIDGNVTVTLPDGNENIYPILATDEFGTTKITIPALKRVGNGDVLTYSICMNIPDNDPICVKGSYLIWD